MAVVLCRMGETILVEVPILAVSLIDLGLEGREDVVNHGVDLVSPKEMRMKVRYTWRPSWVAVNFFTCCHMPEVENNAWRIAQTFFESVRKVGTKGP